MFCVPTVSSQFCSNYNAGFFLLYGNAGPKSAIFGRSSSNLFFSNSDTTLSSGEVTTPSAIDIAPNSVVKTTTSALQLALNSAVKVFTVSSKANSFKPWISYEEECTGSGFAISVPYGKYILTNAHVVADYKSIKVQKHGLSRKYQARVLVINHECGLAILKIYSDESCKDVSHKFWDDGSHKFWEDMNFLDFGDIPPLLEEVVVVGYPEGCDTISVTKGVVTRVEVLKYSYSGAKLMAIQIGSAIKSGNSGGPVIMGNKVAGVAFESLINSKKINYIIPTPVIMMFLNGIRRYCNYFGFCSMNLLYQTMENSQLRDLYKMRTGMTGVLINQINPLSDAHKFLKKDDVILAIDGVPIGNDSTVPFRDKERIDFTHLVSMKELYEPVLFKVFRQGKEYEFIIRLKHAQPLLPVHRDRIFGPSYYLLGGFVFVPLTQDYFDRYDVTCAALRKMPTKAGEQIVIVSKILDNDFTKGYSELENKQVKKVNGVRVDNLKHLRDLIKECPITRMLKLEFVEDMVLGLCPKSAKKATYRIMKMHNIPSAMSRDLR